MSTTRVTIRDIAARAGVHFTTVALALRDSPRLNLRTRQRLQALAADMGYRPDPMLAALHAYRHTSRRPHYQATIAWLNNWPERDRMLDIPEFRKYRSGAHERAAELGYLIEEFWLHERDMTPEKTRRILRARGIQALLLAPQPRSRMWLDFDYTGFSALSLGYSLHPPRMHVVANHHAHSINLLLEELWQLGYRRPGMYVDRNWDEKVGHNWVSGMLLSRWLHPSLACLPLVVNSEEELGIREWVRSYRPDVVISYTGNLRHLRATGLRVPEDVGFASLNVGEADDTTSGIHQNDHLIGRKAVDLLVDMVHRNERGIPETPIRTLVEGVWHPGKTLKNKG